MKRPAIQRKRQIAGRSVLFGCNLAVLPRHPADLAAHLHSMPAILGCGDMLKHCPIRHSGKAGVLTLLSAEG